MTIPGDGVRDADQPSDGLLPVLDEPPKSGVFVDHDDAELTDDDIALGNALGEVIDVEDDGDRGGGLL